MVKIWERVAQEKVLFLGVGTGLMGGVMEC